MGVLSFLGDFNPFIVLWLVVIILFTCVELSTVTLTGIWFAAGGLAALVVAMFNGHWILQVIVFFAVAGVLLFGTRSWAKRFLEGKKQRTNADRAIGQEVRVTERVSNLDFTGKAIVHGQEWTVRAEDDAQIIEEGELVRVVQISGVKLIVKKI